MNCLRVNENENTMKNKMEEMSQSIKKAFILNKQAEMLKKEIEDIENREARATVKRHKERLVQLKEAKEKHLQLLEDKLIECEEAGIKIEMLMQKASLTALEHFIIVKRYIEGLGWGEILQLQNQPEYSIFMYERSTYMRALRNALEKLKRCEEESR